MTTIGKSREDLLREQGLVFFGKIAASLSHELNNAFAIINEHNGLLEDLLAGAEQGIPFDEKKLQRISDKVDKQVERGKEIIKRLNRFAHSTDNPTAEIDVGEMLTAIVALAQRLAGLKGLSLEFDPPARRTTFMGSPFYFQQVIFNCLELFMASADGNRSIKLYVENNANEIIIYISGAALDDSVFEANRVVLELLADKLNGRIEARTDDDGGQSVVLHLGGSSAASGVY